MRNGKNYADRIKKYLITVLLGIAMTLTSGCDKPEFIYDIQYWFEDVEYWFEDKYESFQWWYEDTRDEIKEKFGIEDDEDDEDYEEDEEDDEDDEEDEEDEFDPDEWRYTDVEEDEPFLVTPLPEIDIDSEVNEEVVDLEAGGEDDTPSADEALAGISLDETLKAERYYAYHTLDDEEQKVYKLLYNSLFNFGEKTPMSTTDPDMIDKAFACVLADNPELFYVRGYNLIRYERGGEIEKLSVSGLYTMDKTTAESHQKKADEYVEKCLSGIPSGTDDYVKIKYLYEYIIKNTEYDLKAENGQNYLSVFENGRSVCQGYASAMQYLMLKQGMFCTVVRGVTNSSENHAWNLVKSNGDYYYVDVTWGDMSYDLTVDEGMSSLPKLPEVSYEYLCVTTKDIEATHSIESYFDVPECTARKDYYYVREGNYFESVDTAKLQKVFSKAYSQGEQSVIIKCSDEGVYTQMSDYLTEEGRVFDYLRGSKNVNYVNLENLNELIFYL